MDLSRDSYRRVVQGRDETVTKLPDNHQINKLLSQRYTPEQIAAMYGATPRAVNLRLNTMGVIRRGPQAGALKYLPWDLPDSGGLEKLAATSPFRGLKRLMEIRLGLPGRAHTAYSRALLRKLDQGLVLVYNADVCRLVYEPRNPKDRLGGGSHVPLVIRWPEGRRPPTVEQQRLLAMPTAEEAEAAA